MTIIFVLVYISLFIGAYVGVQLNKTEEQFVVRYDFNRFNLQGVYDTPNFVAIANQRWVEISLENRQREEEYMTEEEMLEAMADAYEQEVEPDYVPEHWWLELPPAPWQDDIALEREITVWETYEESPIGDIYDFSPVLSEVEVAIQSDLGIMRGKQEPWVCWGRKVENISTINPAKSANNNKGYKKPPKLFERWPQQAIV